jgi:hypothetical protein
MFLWYMILWHETYGHVIELSDFLLTMIVRKVGLSETNLPDIS